MNWNQFLQVLIALYVLYYALLLAFDMLKNKPEIGNDSDSLELHFHEENVPLPVTVTDVPMSNGVIQTGSESMNSLDVLPSGGQLHGTGAVSISKLFELAKADLIEYTKHIPY